MSAPVQTAMVPGQIQYKRRYTLWLLILLILVCWPVAVIYYFTRDKVPIQEFRTYAVMPGPAPGAPGAPAGKFCAACGTGNPAGATFCAKCGRALK